MRFNEAARAAVLLHVENIATGVDPKWRENEATWDGVYTEADRLIRSVERALARRERRKE